MTPFDRARAVIDAAIEARAFPAAAVEIGRREGPMWNYAAGRLTFDETAPAVTTDTIFDVASLTKVISTTTLTLLRVADGVMSLADRVADRLGCWTAADRAAVTIADLLEHASGLPAHRPYFKTMTGRAAYERALCDEPLEYPWRMKSLYSDLGFILLGFLLEDAGRAGLDEQFAVWKEQAGIRAPIAFRPPAEWRAVTAPTEQDEWRGRLLVGEVHDENAAALNGVAGHAGLFGTAAAVGSAARWWLSAIAGSPSALGHLPRSFVRASSVPGSSRALGWDRMLTTSSCGTRMSSSAIGHTGFTGGSLWLDPERDLYFTLLTNRVHPTRANDAIQDVRPAFHDAANDDLAEQP